MSSKDQSDFADAKSLNPPTIANTKSHQGWFKFLEEKSENDPDIPKSVADVPRNLQNYVTNLSLRRTSSELELQKELETMEYSVMAGAPDEANLLCLLLELLNAKTVVEIGVFRGITTLTMALCLKKMMEEKEESVERRVIGMDVSEEYVEVGKKYWKEANVDSIIDFRVGDAKESLSVLLKDDKYGEDSVDLCFIDADKESYDDYYEKCLKLTRKGGLIVVDNTLWGGKVLIPNHILSKAEGENEQQTRMIKDTVSIKELNEKISSDSRIERVCFLTIADGVTVCRKK